MTTTPSTDSRSQLPVAVLGAGPIGLAAAVHLLDRGLEPIVLEAGRVGESIRAWGHVRLFSPWGLNMDPRAKELLTATGWQEPDATHHPTGDELVRQYLEPLAAHSSLAPHLRLHTRVLGVSRRQLDKMKDAQRPQAPFLLQLRSTAKDGQTTEHTLLASAVIDATGTWQTPNPLGAHGLPALGETPDTAGLSYGTPDVGAQKERFAGRRVAVVGAGHSAFGNVLDLVALRQEAPQTEISWIVRRPVGDDMFGGAKQDQLAERGRLGQTMRQHWQDGALQLVDDFPVEAVERRPDGLILRSGDGEDVQTTGPFDEVIVSTGFRPDLDLLRELRLDLDPSTESTRALGPLIDPNLHSCGTVPAHGAKELAHPEQDLFVVGMKSYGRAPTFLLRTGYEQVRSISHALAGDWQGARSVDLALPETGACKVDLPNPLKVSCC